MTLASLTGAEAFLYATMSACVTAVVITVIWRWL